MTGFDEWINKGLSEASLEEAAHWIARLDSDDRKPGDRRRFAAWLDMDPMNRWAFEELSASWAKLHILSGMKSAAEHPDVVPFPVSPFEQKKVPVAASGRPSQWQIAVVFCLILIGTVAAFWGQPSTHALATDKGEIKTVALTETSHVELNTATTLRADTEEGKRQVWFAAGEAFFALQEKGVPFTIHIGGVAVTAAEAAFSIHQKKTGLEIVTMTGEVSVEGYQLGAPLLEFDADDITRQYPLSVKLGQGERLFVTDTKYHVDHDIRVEDMALSWRQGVVRFENRPLRQALDEINRYRKTPIHLANPHLNDVPVSGEFSVFDAKDFLNTVQTVYSVRVERVTPSWIVLR